nr:class I SAM-dependent methyltransferase [Flavihumibacter fluvii]
MKWDTKLYDSNHGFVSKYGADLIDLLDPKEGELILDLGAGTGDLAGLISQQGAKVIGLDNSMEMVQSAREKYPHIRFDHKHAHDFSYDRPFDAVFSNATLHWVLDYEKAIACICNALKPKGRFVAEFGGKGNVSCIINALKDALCRRGYSETADQRVWYFPSLSEYTSLLEQNGFRVVFAAHFDRETQLADDNGIKNWLQMFGQYYLQNLPRETIQDIVNDVEEQVRETNFKNGQWYADYVRLRIAAVKE